MAGELYRTYEVLVEQTVPENHKKRKADKTKKPLRWDDELDGALRDTHMIFQDAVCYYTLLLAGLAGNELQASDSQPRKPLNPLWGHLTGALNTETEKVIRRLTANYRFPAGIKTAEDFLNKVYSWPEAQIQKGQLRDLLSQVYQRLGGTSGGDGEEDGNGDDQKWTQFAGNWLRRFSDPVTTQADSTQALRNENYFAGLRTRIRPQNDDPVDDKAVSSKVELKYCFMTPRTEVCGESALCDYLAAFGCENGGKKPKTIGKVEGDVLKGKLSLIEKWGEFPKIPKDATKEQKRLIRGKQIEWREKAKSFPLKSWSGKKPNQLLWFCLRYRWAQDASTREALHDRIKKFKSHEISDEQTDEVTQWRNFLPKGSVPFPFFTKLLGLDSRLDFEFEKAAFAAAAEDVFKYKDRTLEREEKVGKLRRVISAYQGPGETALTEQQSPTGKPITIRGLADDPRWKGAEANGDRGIKELLEELRSQKELDAYGLREGTIGGWGEVRRHFLRLARRSKGKPKWESRLPELLEKAVDKEQTANRQGFGSADFFHMLCKPAFHHLWLPSGERNGIKDFIPHYVRYAEWLEDLRDLLAGESVELLEDTAVASETTAIKPISFTWPGLLNRHREPSYRYYDFKAKLNETLKIGTLFRRVRPAADGVPTYTRIENAEVKLSARRLRRDKILTSNGSSVDALWCPPLVLQGNAHPSPEAQPRAGKKKGGKWAKSDMEVSFSLMARPLPDDPWNAVCGVPSEDEIHPVHLKVSVPIEQGEQEKLYKDSLHWPKGSLKGFDEDDDKRKHFRWPIDIQTSKAQASQDKEDKVSAEKLWCGNGTGEFHGFTVKQSKYSDSGDTKKLPEFHLLSVDLGNRCAAAFARLRIHADAGGDRLISSDDFLPKIWADVERTGLLKMRGEGADTWQIVTEKNRVHLEKQIKREVGPVGSFVFAEEPYGTDGRGRFDSKVLPDFKKLADQIVSADSCSLAGVEKMTYPELGDHLVYRMKRHLGRLRTLFNLLWRVAGDKEKDSKGKYTKRRTDDQKAFHLQMVVETLARGAYPKRPRRDDEREDAKDESLRHALASQEQWQQLKDAELLDEKKGKDEEKRTAELHERVADWNWAALTEALKNQIRMHFLGDETTATLLEQVIEFCLPLRGRHWKWKRNGTSGDRLYWGDEDGSWIPKVQGMRGLSIKRLEQILNLRQRCQSFAKLEDRFSQRFVHDDFNPLDPMRRGEADDPCSLLLDRSNRLREQRVDQTAHLILTEALGLELKNPAEVAEKWSRKREVDLHGEYKPRLGRNGEPVPRCSVIVLENLERYRTSQERTRQENSRLMKWAHRAILEKLEDMCAPFGITIMVVDPAFSSRFEWRTGLPGVRVNSVSRDFEQQMPYAAWLKQKDKNNNETKLAKDIRETAALFNANKDFKGQLLIAVEGGKEFLSVRATERDKLNADINAAVNIGVRAVADPRRWDIFPRLRTKQIANGEVQVLNWRGVFGQFGRDDEQRRLCMIRDDSSSTASPGTAAVAAGKSSQKKKGDTASAAQSDTEASSQSSEFPPFFVNAVEFGGLPHSKAYQPKASDSPRIEAYPQGLYLKVVERVCAQRIQQINSLRLGK